MKLETQFNKGDSAWYMKNNKPTNVTISAIHIFYVGTDQDQIKYSGKDVKNPVTWIDHTNLFEDILFHSKDELLEALFSDKKKRKSMCKGKNCSAINGVNHSPECIAAHDAIYDAMDSPELFAGTNEALDSLTTLT